MTALTDQAQLQAAVELTLGFSHNDVQIERIEERGEGWLVLFNCRQIAAVGSTRELRAAYVVKLRDGTLQPKFNMICG